MPDKKPPDLGTMFDRIEAAVARFPKAAMFALAGLGFTSAFEQLIACILSIRTYDEVSLVAAQRLFARARTPAALASLPPAEIEALIRPTTFGERKAVQIRDIARRVETGFGGVLPCDRDRLLSFAGVGPKCANLALGIACGLKFISVDVHVHRVTNRWGYVATRSPEQTLAALEQKLPQDYWIDINRLLVPFGKHICTGTLPHCSACPVLEFCQQTGVSQHR